MTKAAKSGEPFRCERFRRLCESAREQRAFQRVDSPGIEITVVVAASPLSIPIGRRTFRATNPCLVLNYTLDFDYRSCHPCR